MPRSWLPDPQIKLTVEMKSIPPLLLAALIATAIGWVACRSFGFAIDERDVAFAGASAVFGTILALVPAALFGTAQDEVAQGALLSTVVQMLATLVLGAVVWLGHMVGHHAAFLLWLTVFYWVLLVALVIILAARIRAAAPRTVGNANAGAGPTTPASR